MSNSIRELQKRKDRLLDEYHEKIRSIDVEIDAIRKRRGQSLKVKDFGPYYEEGRDAKRDPYGNIK